MVRRYPTADRGRIDEVQSIISRNFSKQSWGLVFAAQMFFFVPVYSYAGPCWGKYFHWLARAIDPIEDPAEFRWIGPLPDRGRWKAFVKFGDREQSQLRDILRTHRTTSSIELTTYEHYTRFGEPSFDNSHCIFRHQEVRKLTNTDETLLKASRLDTLPREAGRWELRTTERSVYGDIITGSGTAIASDIVGRSAGKFMWDASKVLGETEKVNEIVFTHTHPFISFVLNVNGTSPIGTHFGLSKADLDTARRYSLESVIPVRMRAILPNGFSFEAVYRKGIRIAP